MLSKDLTQPLLSFCTSRLTVPLPRQQSDRTLRTWSPIRPPPGFIRPSPDSRRSITCPNSTASQRSRSPSPNSDPEVLMLNSNFDEDTTGSPSPSPVQPTRKRSGGNVNCSQKKAKTKVSHKDVSVWFESDYIDYFLYWRFQHRVHKQRIWILIKIQNPRSSQIPILNQDGTVSTSLCFSPSSWDLDLSGRLHWKTKEMCLLQW